MNKTYVTILLGFLVMFAAGAIVGVVQSKTAAHQRHDRSWLADQLHLTDAQRQQMQKIWSDAMSKSHDQAIEKRRELQQQRASAIRDLLTPAQQIQFEKIEKQYEQESADLQKERGRAVQEAVARTKEILNDQQRAKYDELLKQREAEHSGWEKPHHPTTRKDIRGGK